MMNVFEDMEPEKQALLGIECHTVEQILPNSAVLHAYILSSDSPVLRKITHQNAGKVYAEITVSGTRMSESSLSTRRAMAATSMPVRPQVGQLTTLT